jgi:hypothetical protein
MRNGFRQKPKRQRGIQPDQVVAMIDGMVIILRSVHTMAEGYRDTFEQFGAHCEAQGLLEDAKIVRARAAEARQGVESVAQMQSKLTVKLSWIAQASGIKASPLTH